MANTITPGINVVALTVMDSDYSWTESKPGHVNGVPIFTIVFRAGGTSANTLVLRSGSLTGGIFLSVTLAADVTQTYLFGGAILGPCMVFTDCTFTAGALWSFCFGHN